MATWLAHIRIAKPLLSLIAVDPQAFLVGSIGPDCGFETQEGYFPSKRLTHWQIRQESKEVFSDFFYEDYVKDRLKDKRADFYLGYYLHLISDVAWHERVSRPIMEKNKQGKGWDRDFLIEVRKDWYDIDRLYLRQHPQDYAYRVFSDIVDFPNIYLPFFPEDAFERKLAYIKRFYASKPRNLERSFVYFSPEMMDDFVRFASGYCLNKLEEKGFIFP